MKILLDTNIVIDSIASRIPFDKPAQDIILLAAGKKISAAITASTASDIYYLTKKRLGSSETASSVLQKLFMILDVISVDKNDCIKAFETGILDYENSLLSVCAKKSKADYIVTRNLKDFTNSPIKAISPQDFLAEMQ